MSIIDDGQTYFKDVSMVNVGGEGGIGRSANSKADTSKDDSSDMRRREDK